MVTAAVLAAGTVGLVAVAGMELRRWPASVRVTARIGTPARDRRAPAWSVRLVDRTGLDIDPRFLVDVWVGAALVTAAATPFVSGAPVALVVVLAAPPVALVAARNRGARMRSAQIPGALEMIAASLRGGVALPVAIGEAATLGGQLGRELSDVARRVRDGTTVDAAVERWAQRHDADTALAGAALTMAAAVGGPAADALESAAASLREAAAAAAEVGALSVQARLSAMVLSAAPIGFTFLLASVDPASARFLVGTPAGWLCIVVGVGLDAVGAWWMHRLVQGAA